MDQRLRAQRPGGQGSRSRATSIVNGRASRVLASAISSRPENAAVLMMRASSRTVRTTTSTRPLVCSSDVVGNRAAAMRTAMARMDAADAG